jgi:PAS domain-containing protein
MSARSERDAMLVTAFEQSRMPQALIALDGRIAAANAAFAQLLGLAPGIEGKDMADTALATVIPGFARAVRAVHDSGKPSERRARVFRGADAPPLELTLWLSPLETPGAEVHLVLRVEEADPRGRR